jgi:hypothetical protein
LSVAVYIDAETSGEERDILIANIAGLFEIEPIYFIVNDTPDSLVANGIYYVKNQKDIFFSEDGTSLTPISTLLQSLEPTLNLSFGGAVSDTNSITKSGYYALILESFDFFTWSHEREGLQVVYVNFFDTYIDLKTFCTALGMPCYYHYLKTLPSYEDIQSDIASGFVHLYFIEELQDVYAINLDSQTLEPA